MVPACVWYTCAAEVVPITRSHITHIAIKPKRIENVFLFDNRSFQITSLIHKKYRLKIINDARSYSYPDDCLNAFLEVYFFSCGFF
jgi:hypothetical protein